MHQRLLIWNFWSQLNFSEEFSKHKDKMQAQFIFCWSSLLRSAFLLKKDSMSIVSKKWNKHFWDSSSYSWEQLFVKKLCSTYTTDILYPCRRQLDSSKIKWSSRMDRMGGNFFKWNRPPFTLQHLQTAAICNIFLITHLSFLGDHWTSLYIFCMMQKNCDENHMSTRDSLKMAGVDSKIWFNSF